MTGNQAQKQLNELQTTTRVILGKTSVPAAKLRNIDLKKGTAQVHHNGLTYEAILVKGAFRLTGEFQ